MQATMADNRKSLIRDFFSDVLLAHDYSPEYLQHRRAQLGLNENMGFRLAVLEVNDADAVSNRLTKGDSSVLSFRTYQCLKRESEWKMPHLAH